MTVFADDTDTINQDGRSTDAEGFNNQNQDSINLNQSNTQVTELQRRVDELEQQLNNVAKSHYVREVNRKNNVRKVVREYLSELKND